MSNAPKPVDWFLVRHGIENSLNRVLAFVGDVRVVIDQQYPNLKGQDLRLRKGPVYVHMSCDLDAARRDPATRLVLSARSATFVHLLSRTVPEITECMATTNDDGGERDGVVCFCARAPGPILVPDADFFLSNAYRAIRTLGARPPRPWRQRSDILVWRGATTGMGDITAAAMSAANPALIQRTRMCLALRDAPDCNVKFSSLVQSADPIVDQSRLDACDLVGGRVQAEQWVGHKFALDVDGNTNAWSNLLQRLLLGCCVLKVASKRGFRQWYYDDLVPWRHFVPVAADLSDLREKVAWCRSHLPECEAIAVEGHALAHRMTFDREMARGVEAMNRRLLPNADDQAAPFAS